MNDSIKGFVVTTTDLHEEDAKRLMEAIRMFAGVVSVEPSVIDYEDHMNRAVVKSELRGKLWEVLK